LRLRVLITLVVLGAGLGAEERFPPPEFESGYQLPSMTWPHPRQTWHEWLDVALLAVALGLGIHLVHRRRSRTAMAWLTATCLVYFGFYREGCICPVGSIQNVTLTLSDGGYTLPVTVALGFALPLVVALLWGRIFCGGVCPLGAIQDLVLVRAVRVPGWLDRALRLLPHAYLGLTILYVATGTLFAICKYDPFVAAFRLSGSFTMLLVGAALLLMATSVARPYCRYLCPYGVLLGWCSRLSWRRVTITPDVCTSCDLCHDACPFGAIVPPAPSTLLEGGG